MAKFIFTVESDDLEEIQSFLAPRRDQIGEITVPVDLGPNPIQAPQFEEPKRKGRPPKEAPLQPSSPDASTTPNSSASETKPSEQSETVSVETSTEPSSEAVTLADVKALINQAIKVKPAKAVVDALTVACGTAAPGAMDDGQLAKAKVTLEGLLNG